MSQQTASMKFCNRCKSYQAASRFAGNRRDYRTCLGCRERDRSYRPSPRPEVAADRAAIDFSSLEDSFMRASNIEAYGLVEEPYRFEAKVNLDSNHLSMNDEDVAKLICLTLGNVDGYRYILQFANNPALTFQAMFYATCCQSDRLHAQTQPDERQRQFVCRQRYSCNGRIEGSIDRNERLARVSIQHDMPHEPPRPESVETPTHIRQFIHDLAPRQDAREVYHSVRREFPDDLLITQAQIYYWWRESVRRLYQMDNDELISSRMLIRQRYSTHGYREVYWRYDNTMGVKAFGFATPLFNRIISAQSVNEYHIDSTFKTNRAGYELFVVISSVNGAGFPIAYLVLDTHHAVDRDHAKTAEIQEFFRALRNEGLRPHFMMTDKDSAQIYAIRSIWGDNVARLCMWHARRSVKLKLSSKTPTARYNASQAHEDFSFIDPLWVPAGNPTTVISRAIECKEIQRLMDIHHCHHPLIPSGTLRRDASSSYRASVLEMYEYCRQNDLIHAWSYMYNSWYKREKWSLRARSAIADKIPIANTTMMIEAHWKVLKRDHLYRFNQARLDLLIWVIIEKHCTDLLIKFDVNIIQRRAPLSWEREFVRQWNESVDREESSEADQQYQPVISTWICGCPEFTRGTFFLCKHLVRRSLHGKIAVRQFFISRRNEPPFVQLLLVSAHLFICGLTIFIDHFMIISQVNISSGQSCLDELLWQLWIHPWAAMKMHQWMMNQLLQQTMLRTEVLFRMIRAVKNWNAKHWISLSAIIGVFRCSKEKDLCIFCNHGLDTWKTRKDSEEDVPCHEHGMQMTLMTTPDIYKPHFIPLYSLCWRIIFLCMIVYYFLWLLHYDIILIILYVQHLLDIAVTIIVVWFVEISFVLQ